MTACCKRRVKFLIKLPEGPLDKLTTCFEELCLNVVAPPARAQPRNQWIFTPTWALINKRAVLQQQGKLLQQAAHLIGRQITARLKGDRTKRAVVATEIIERHLTAGEPKGAWQSLKGWYKAATDCAPKASKMSLSAQTAEPVTLYGRVSTKGDPIPIQVDKADISDDIPSDAKLRDCIRALWNGHATGPAGLQTEHIKVWLANTVHKEEGEGDIGLG
jgi:hypothetical protein